MPLVRVQVRNEYGLGQPELYREADREDPKAVLDGVAVAGLVGILRQLGDLAEFAAEVFHGLQEQVMNTSSRSHKLTVRLQRMESALPPLEKAVLAQKSHLHFAYTAGSVWHAHLQNEQNHFICGDLPQFIMDSYEECRDPPRLHLLDKFDSGGPGCCLKKYSDPTFYRRASASSGEANIERVSKVWKAHRSKKNRTRKRNGVSHGASISNYSDRMQFASLKDGVQASPSKPVSAVDATLESDLGDQLNSFDSRPGSGYIECVFHPTYSVKPEEHDPKESPFSSLRMHLNDTIDLASVDEHSGVVDDNSPRSLSQEQTGPRSPCVTWDEKTEIVEIVEPTGHPSDDEEITEMLLMDFDRDAQEKGTANFTSVDHTDFHFDNEDIPTSVSGRNQLDDVESETDNYVDALNTIESESETDLDYQTKREIERSSIFIDEETQDGTDGGVIAHHSYLQPLNLESCSAAYSSSTILVSNDKPYSSSSEFYAKEESPPLAGKSSIIGNSWGMDFCGNDDTKEESPQMAGKSSVIGNSPSMDLCGNDDILDGSNVASVVSNLPYSGFVEPNPKAPMSDKITSVSRESQKSPTEPSGVQSVMFWTNGSLLGLEPSKPPDFSVFNAVVQDSVSGGTDKVDNPSCQSSVLNGDGDAGKPDKSVQSSKILQQISSKSSTSCHNDQNGISDKKTSWRFLTTNVDAKHGKKGDSHSSIRLNDDAMHNSSKTSAVVPETEQAVTPDVNAISSDASQRDGENEYQMFELSNGFLVNGFQRKVSFVHGEKSNPPSSRKTDGFEKSRNQSVASQSFSERNFKGYFRSGSLANSPSSSPPLQHMKISFQPINGFEGSKLKLKFPDGSYSHDSGRDILPTFQLVPEPTTPRHDIRSESDDDTFCRSSPYMSDDYLSHQSDSNSEQWESDDSPPSKNNELYDVLRRISSAESVSSFVELDRTGHGSVCVDYGLKSPNVETSLEPCQSGRSLDLPSLRSLSPLFAQEMEIGSDAKDFPKSLLPKEPTPLPPPLPPIQWRGVMKSDSDLTTGKQASVSETLDHAFAMNTLGSTISPQSKPSQAKQQQNTDETISFTPKNKLPELQKLDGQKEVNQAIKGSGIDEKDDFLHQIRSKSFSLRRTVTEKSNVSSGPAANVKVTAILEKANAIRQAVGSDDGEDEDNWSDT